MQRFEDRFDRLQSSQSGFGAAMAHLLHRYGVDDCTGLEALSQPGFGVAGQYEALKAILMRLRPHTQLILFISSIYFQKRLGSETLTAHICLQLG